jgi:hypothetical protein
VRDELFRNALATHAKPVARNVRSGLRSRFSKASKIATNLKRVNRAKEGVKTSGYADEITGIARRTIMQSHLRETPANICGAAGAFRRPAHEAERL